MPKNFLSAKKCIFAQKLGAEKCSEVPELGAKKCTNIPNLGAEKCIKVLKLGAEKCRKIMERLGIQLKNTPDLRAARFSMLPYKEQDQMTNIPLYAV